MSIGALNRRTLNKATLNSSVSDFALTEVFSIYNLSLGEVNAEPCNVVPWNASGFFTAPGEQTLLVFSQFVGSVIDSFTAIPISQDVSLTNETGIFTPISINQNVSITPPSFTCIRIAQNVNSPSTFLSLHGWDIDILINGSSIPKDNIQGSDIVITKQSNQNTICTFSVNVSSPLQFLEFIDGGELVINYITTSSVTRVFTGVVDLPEIDLINKIIKINASDRREDLIKELMTPLLPTIGRYSLDIQGKITSVKQEVDYRLSTIASDLDFDAYNIPNINSWLAKATPDFTLTESSIFYQTPKITWQSRGNIINDTTVTVNYNYTRLYQYQRNFAWQDSGDPSYSAPPGLIWKKDNLSSHLTVGTLTSAINSAGWKSSPNSLTYVDHYTGIGGTFPLMLGGPTYNPLNDDIGTSVVAGLVGPPFQYFTIIYPIPPTTKDEVRITSASWTANTRFSQNIQESYVCNVKSSQSIDQFGSISSFNDYSVTDAYDSSEWENYKAQTALPANSITPDGINYYSNQNNNIAAFRLAILTAIDIAKTNILSTHRETKVSLQLPIQPTFELRHTLEIDTTEFSCKGKLSMIRHVIDLSERARNSTEVDIILMRAEGSAVDVPSSVPPRPPDTPIFDNTTVVFGSRRDQDKEANAPASDNWNGYIGSINHGFQNPLKTQFIIDTPAIPDELRQQRILQSGGTFETSIPNDSLDIEF